MIVVTLCSIGTIEYLLPYISTIFNVSPVQSLLLLTIVVICFAIITVAAVKYTISIPLIEFLNRIRTNWTNHKSLNVLATSDEETAVLQTITDITSSQTNRINELENSTNNPVAYKRLIMTMSHQLRTPLTGLKWAITDISQDCTKGVQPDPALISGASEAVTRINILIEKLLSGLNDQSKSTLSFEALDIESCLDQVLRESTLLATKLDIVLSVEKQNTLIPLVRGNKQSIEFVLHSLVTNAIYYSTKGNTVTVSILHKSNNVEVAVHNYGQPILDNERSFLFAEFGRGSEAIRVNPEGSGLSLYLAHQIIVDHGGTISFESDSKQGTTFTITVPISSLGQLETSINY